MDPPGRRRVFRPGAARGPRRAGGHRTPRQLGVERLRPRAHDRAHECGGAAAGQSADRRPRGTPARAHRHTDLVSTLETYLAHNANMNATAATVFAHRHTVAYRLERIKELTGLDPDRKS